MILAGYLSEREKLKVSISDLEILQKNMKDVNVKLLIMYNQLPAIIYSVDLSKNPTLTYISYKGEEITGYKLSSFYETENFLSKISIEEDQSKWERIFQGESPIIIRLKHSDGSIIWTEHYVNLSFDILGATKRIDVVALDITRTKKFELSLLNERRLNSTVFDKAASLIILTDISGRIENINSATVKKLLLNKESVKGKYIYDVLLLPEDKKSLQEVLEDIFEFQKIADSLILRCLSNDNSIYYMDWRLALIEDNQDSDSKIIWIGIDHTSKREAEKQLRDLNRSLEDKVTQRTLELQTSNRELNSALEIIKATQEKLIQSEKLASLGQLISGLSHEINNPIGVVKASAETLLAEWTEEIQSLERSPIPDSLQNILRLPVDPMKVLTGVLNRNARKLMTKSFIEQSIQNPETLSEILVDSGVTKLSKDEIQLVKDLNIKSNDINLLKRLLLMDRSINHILLAANRLSKITYTLKNFSGLQSKNELSEYSLEDSIESALSIYQDYFNRGIALVKNYKYNGKIQCNTNDLVQLFSQLVWNAIQAIGTEGKLVIETDLSEDQVFVKITDTGPGIVEEHRAKIFVPFFSTKQSGDGLGLGLYLVKQIAIRHRADISYETSDKGTTFKVTFPI
jgi:PAS domain S-box-containing protein